MWRCAPVCESHNNEIPGMGRHPPTINAKTGAASCSVHARKAAALKAAALHLNLTAKSLEHVSHSESQKACTLCQKRRGHGTRARKIVTSGLVQVQAVAGGGLGEGFFEEGGHVLDGAKAAGGGDLFEGQGRS